MKVKFLKYCPWSYRLTRGILTRHAEGSTAQVADIEGKEMINAGYAEQVKAGRPFAKPAETKVVKPAETKVVVPKEKKAKKKPTKKASKKAGGNK